MKIESSSSSYVNGNYSSKGFSGLASGLDTESMVQELLSGTQSKIDKQEGLKQQLVWKQEMYRSIIQDLLDFKSKYFDRTSTKSLLSSGLYNAMTALSNSSAVKVSASSSAATGTTSVEVAQLATATALKSAGSVSGALSGVVDADALTDLAANAEGGKVSLDVTYNGVKKAVTVDINGINDADGLAAALQEGIKKAHGSGITVTAADGRISLKGSDSGQEISLSGNKELLGAMGMREGQSNKINGSMKLKDMSFATELQGGQFSFEINGTKFSYSEETTLNQIISDINGSDAGVRLTFNSMDDSFKLESTSTGAGFDITMSQSEGNLLTALFGSGVSSGSKVSSDVLTTTSITADGGDIKDGLEKATFTLTVNGTKQTITLAKRKEEDGGAYTSGEIIDLLNKELDKRFDGNIQIEGNGSYLDIKGGLQVSFDKSSGADTDIAYALGFSTKEGGKNNLATADTTVSDLSEEQQEQLEKLGITSGTLGDLSGRYSFSAETGRLTLDGSEGADGLTLTDGEQEVFHATALGGGSAASTADALKAQTRQGKNAVVKINDVWTERSSNTFSNNGITFELKATTGQYKTDSDGNVILDRKDTGDSFTVDEADGAVNTAVTIETERNTDQIYDQITSFVNDYNTLIEKLNGYVDEEASYKEYAPLTSDQKKEMSEREIELWEEKAKEGLLRRDSTISTFLTQMRQALYERPEGSSIALYDIGIETSSSWRDKGKLVIDENKLRSAIEQKPTEVMNLFNNSNGGVATRINDILYKTANDTSGSPGTLVQIAGMKNRSTDANNELYSRMKQVDAQIEKLKNQYEQQKTRYWKQFNAMEQMISNMNQQSAWLTQQLG